jgi:DNA-directed RNA polymerase subunit M/transcription elongation factor TFIIS
MLYIDSNPEHRLREICHNCGYNTPDSELHTHQVISSYNSSIKKTSFAEQMYMGNLKSDPTIPHSSEIECPNKECTRDSSQPKDVLYVRAGDVDLKYVYHCCYCDHTWNTDS